MPEILPAELARVQLTWAVAGGEISVGTFHFRQPTAGVDDVEARRMANACKAFYTGISGILTAATLTGVVVRRSNHSGAAGGDWEQAWSFPDITGSVGAGVAGLPPQVALCLSLVTGTPIRSARGRLFVGPLRADTVQTGSDGATVAAATSTSLITAANTLRTSSATAGAPWVVFSRTKQQLYPIASVKVGNRFDTIRRRRSAMRETYATS
jgi:hypothetical protein